MQSWINWLGIPNSPMSIYIHSIQYHSPPFSYALTIELINLNGKLSQSNHFHIPGFIIFHCKFTYIKAFNFKNSNHDSITYNHLSVSYKTYVAYFVNSANTCLLGFNIVLKSSSGDPAIDFN